MSPLQGRSAGLRTTEQLQKEVTIQRLVISGSALVWRAGFLPALKPGRAFYTSSLCYRRSESPYPCCLPNIAEQLPRLFAVHWLTLQTSGTATSYTTASPKRQSPKHPLPITHFHHVTKEESRPLKRQYFRSAASPTHLHDTTTPIIYHFYPYIIKKRAL